MQILVFILFLFLVVLKELKDMCGSLFFGEFGCMFTLFVLKRFPL